MADEQKPMDPNQASVPQAAELGMAGPRTAGPRAERDAGLVGPASSEGEPKNKAELTMRAHSASAQASEKSGSASFERAELTNKEVSATDLLSLWGGASGASAKKTARPEGATTSESISRIQPLVQSVPPSALPPKADVSALAPPPKPPPTPAQPAMPQPMQPTPPPVLPLKTSSDIRKAEPVDWFQFAAQNAPEQKPLNAETVVSRAFSTPTPPPLSRPQAPKPPQAPKVEQSAAPPPQKPPEARPKPAPSPPPAKPRQEEREREKESEEKPKQNPLHREKPDEKLLKKAAPVFEGEIVSSTHVQEPEPETLDEKEGFGAQFDELLEELHLTRKHIFWGIGCLMFFVIMIVGGIAGYNYFKNRKTASQEAVQPPQKEEQKSVEQPAIKNEETGITATGSLGTVTAINPIIVGTTGINATVAIGQEKISGTSLAFYILSFRRLKNAYDTDINALLNKASDRRSRLQSHLALLRKLHQDGTGIFQKISESMQVLQERYESLEKQQQIDDVNFFEQLSMLNAQTTENILNDFMGVTQEIATLRARFKALQKVKELYVQALPRLESRIKDIDLNAEALVSGIKVYDVKGSDLNLVLPVNNGETNTRSTLYPSSSTVTPLLPTHPSQVTTGGRDYITSPGGGF